VGASPATGDRGLGALGKATSHPTPP